MNIRKIFQSTMLHPGVMYRQIEQRARILTSEAVTSFKDKIGATWNGWFGSGYMSGGEKSPSGIAGTGTSLHLNHAIIRQNARTAVHDTVQARAIVERFTDSVVDVGLKLECIPVAEILGIDQDRAEDWAEEVEQRFDLWARDKQQHRSETMNFYQAQRQYSWFQQRDNDMFTRLYYSRRQRLQNRLQYEFIDPNQIIGSSFTSSYIPYAFNIDGISRDKAGREISYLVTINDGNGYYREAAIPRVSKKTGRIHMLHGFAPEYAGQGRGFSRLTGALQEFQRLTDFTLAHIKKAIIHSQINMFVKPSETNPGASPFDGVLSDAGVGPAGDSFSVNPDTSESTTTRTNSVGYVQLKEAGFQDPGSVGVFNLQEGEDLKPFDTKSPSTSFDSFVESFTSYLCASMSMPIEVLLMKFNANYSASRAALILFWRVACIWREEMAIDFLNPMYEMWLAEEIAAGRLTAPGWSDPRLRAAWLNNNWIGAPMPNIDPMRTAKADKEYATMGATTLDNIARNLNGSSGKANRRKLARQYKELPPDPWVKRGNQ